MGSTLFSEILKKAARVCDRTRVIAKQWEQLFRYVLLALLFVFCRWLVWTSWYIPLPEGGAPPRLFAHPSKKNIQLTLVKAIRSARHSLFLSMFGLSDPSILSALFEITSKGVVPTIYYDPVGSPDIRQALRGASLHPIHNAGFLHHKILVIDHALVFLGSMNFTTQSLAMHDNLMVGFTSAQAAQFLESNVPHASGHFCTAIAGQEVSLWLLPDAQGFALADVRKILQSATKTVRAALFTLTHPALVHELISAHERGVKVTVVIDKHAALGASKQAIDVLQTHGVVVRVAQGVALMHHKFAWIDGHTLVMGSANWTRAAFTKNCDCLCILRDLRAEQTTALCQAWRRLVARSSPSAAAPACRSCCPQVL